MSLNIPRSIPHLTEARGGASEAKGQKRHHRSHFGVLTEATEAMKKPGLSPPKQLHTDASWFLPSSAEAHNCKASVR